MNKYRKGDVVYLKQFTGYSMDECWFEEDTKFNWEDI